MAVDPYFWLQAGAADLHVRTYLVGLHILLMTTIKAPPVLFQCGAGVLHGRLTGVAGRRRLWGKLQCDQLTGGITLSKERQADRKKDGKDSCNIFSSAIEVWRHR